MEFSANRLELLELSKRVMKLANDSSPIAALKGIYIESDEDAGEISMITTNYEAAIFMKEKAKVTRSGKIVFNAKLLTGILTLSSGEDVAFSADRGTVKITSGKTVFNFAYLSAEHYPKPVLPFPEEAVKLSGICALARKTVFAVAKDESRGVLQCISLKVKQNSAYAAACDGVRLMLVKSEAESSGATEFLLPAKSFQILASISTDEDFFDVGVVGNEVVFTKKNLLFSMKQLTGNYMDTNALLKTITPKYSAIVNAAELRSALDLMSVGNEKEPVNICFTEGIIRLVRGGDSTASTACIKADISGKMPKDGFNYNIDYLLTMLKVITGKVKLEMDARGFMLIKSKGEVYLQPPIVRKKVKAVKKENAKEAA